MLEALRSGMLGLGPFLRRFERDFAAFTGTAHATAVSSGTAGLHLAVRMAGIGPGDEVITSPTSFVASANSILYERGTPVFADVDPEHAEHRSRRDRGGDHAAHARDPARAHLRLPVRDRSHQRDRRAPRPRRDRGRRRGGRHAREGPAGRHARQPRDLRLLPEQADHDGRGRHGHDRRRRAAGGPAVAHEPGPRRHGPVARARSPRLQLPPRRALGRGGRRAGRADRSDPRAARGRRGTLRRAAGGHPRCRPARAGLGMATCARGSSTSCVSIPRSIATT